jgi:hypothetical protein
MSSRSHKERQTSGPNRRRARATAVFWAVTVFAVAGTAAVAHFRHPDRERVDKRDSARSAEHVRGGQRTRRPENLGQPVGRPFVSSGGVALTTPESLSHARFQRNVGDRTFIVPLGKGPEPADQPPRRRIPGGGGVITDLESGRTFNKDSITMPTPDTADHR